MLEKDVLYHEKHDLIEFCAGKKFKTILADPPWQFQNRTGKMAPEHKRLNRYESGKDRAHYIKLQNYCLDMFGEIIQPDWDYSVVPPAGY